MNLVPVLPVEYVYGVRDVLLFDGLVGFCLLLLAVAAAFSVFGVIALFLSRIDG